MAKKEEQLAAQQAAEAAAAAQASTSAMSDTPNRDKWLANLRAKYGDELSEDELYGKSMEGYDAEHEYAKQSRADLDQFSKTIQNNPTMLAFYQKLIELGEDNAEMALLELGDDLVSYLTGEIDSNAYQERKRLKAETEAENSRRSEELGQKKTAQRAALEAWAEKKGLDPDEFVSDVQTKLLEPIAAFSAEEALFESLYNMLYHDEDVEAAEVRGRNATITTQRKKNAGATDGQTNRSSAAAGVQGEEGKNPLARMASRGAAARNL